MKSLFPNYYIEDYEAYSANGKNITYPNETYQPMLITLLNIVSWYIGAIFGSMVGASFVHTFKKSTIYVSTVVKRGAKEIQISQLCYPYFRFYLEFP